VPSHIRGGGTSRIRGGTSGVPHRVLNTPVINIIIDQTHYSCYLIRIKYLELSVTHTRGGVPLGSVGVSLESRITSSTY